MKPERLDVTSEELEALLEGVRAPLGEVSYQKLQAAIHTHLCNRVTGNPRGDDGEIASAVVPLQHGEDRKGAEAGRH